VQVLVASCGQPAGSSGDRDISWVDAARMVTAPGNKHLHLAPSISI